MSRVLIRGFADSFGKGYHVMEYGVGEMVCVVLNCGRNKSEEVIYEVQERQGRKTFQRLTLGEYSKIVARKKAEKRAKRTV